MVIRAASLILAVVMTAIPGCRERGPAAVLLFKGTGTSPNDVSAVEAILRRQQLTYRGVDSAQLDAMTSAQLRAHQLLIVPGGSFEVMGGALAAGTPQAIRSAVTAGLNYLGICAGAFLAGDVPRGGLNLTGGVAFPFYALEAEGVRKAPVWVRPAGAAALQHYWEDGPALPGWGDVVALYPDDTPAVVQGRVGAGWVVLAGVHAEAPETWRGGMAFATPARVDNDYAATLIDAALRGRALAHY